MNFNFLYENNSPRASYRAAHPGLRLLVRGSNTLHEVLNISTSGIAFKGVFSNVRKEEIIYFTLLFEGKTLLSQIKGKIMHVDSARGFTGCEYVDISEAQLKKLDVFILQLQKLEIKKQQAKKNELD